MQEVASRALDRCAAAAPAWTPQTVQEQVTRIVTEAGVQAAPAELQEFIITASEVAVSDCFSILPPGAATPEHVAYLTSVDVVTAETALRDQLTASTPEQELERPDMPAEAEAAGLDEGQVLAAAAVASRDPQVVVEGAAGSGNSKCSGTKLSYHGKQRSYSELRCWCNRHDSQTGNWQSRHC